MPEVKSMKDNHPESRGKPGGRREGAGRKAGVPNRKTTGNLDLHRWAFNMAWSGRGKNPPKNCGMQKIAALRFHQALVAMALRGNDRAAALGVERAFGRMPQPIVGAEGENGSPLSLLVKFAKEYPDGDRS